MVVRAVPETVERQQFGLFHVRLARGPADVAEDVDRQAAVAHRQPPHLETETDIAPASKMSVPRLCFTVFRREANVVLAQASTSGRTRRTEARSVAAAIFG